ncbi:MAG TPA: cupredoxin family copper-binding protein [Candidatus Limnocylindrales bacterium]|nr:cupredoxin family copper-binding protein [Candidatus Limnocylindrales bacterium]
MTDHAARPRLRRPTLAAALAIGATFLVGGAAVAADQSVSIANFAFGPATVTVTVGDSVTWTNTDAVVHTATASDGSWDTGDIAEGATASITFQAAGTFAYICTPHPTMTGTVIVQAPAGGGGGGGGGGAPTTPPTDTTGLSRPADGADLGPAIAGLLGVGLLLGCSLVVRRRSGSA